MLELAPVPHFRTHGMLFQFKMASLLFSIGVSRAGHKKLGHFEPQVREKRRVCEHLEGAEEKEVEDEDLSLASTTSSCFS